MLTRTFESIETWAEYLARLWVERLQALPDMRICLAAGNTPGPVCEAMVRACQAGETSFCKATIFALDEYGELAPDDAGRCANMIRRCLLDPVDLPADNFHELATEAENLEQVCADYDAAIGEGFDLAILGIGLNGHLGMNEPGTSAQVTTHRVELHPASIQSAAGYLDGREPPRWGITVGMKHLLKAKEVWLLATGGAKAKIVAQVARGEPTTDIPASLLNDHPECTLFLDTEAAAML
jgi:6-phosphogluconolactonase/glucosamine-6-phosphate isomerase/deaminase